MKRVIVTAISEVKQDDGAKKEHRSFKTIEFSTPDRVAITDAIGTHIARIQPRKTSLNLYENSYLDDKMQLGYDSQLGESFAGDIVTRTVQPYEIPSDKEGEAPRVVNTFTTVVLGDTESGDWESKVKAAFKSRGHELANPNTPNNFSIASEESLAAFEAAKKEEKVA